MPWAPCRRWRRTHPLSTRGPVLRRKNISEEAACKIAPATIEACKNSPFDISVVVVDRNGLVRLSARANAAWPPFPQR